MSDKKKYAIEELGLIYDAAKEAGIFDSVFISFGVLLGIVRENDFIGHDTDMDMGIQADKITPEQEVAYYHALKKRKLFHARRKWSFRKSELGFNRGELLKGSDYGPIRFSWLSLKQKEYGIKCCNWFMFPWNGYYWWSKSGMWVHQRKFDVAKWKYDIFNDDAIMLGIPESYVKDLITINFHGIDVNIPARAGSCVDWFYPVWMIPRNGGSSEKRAVCIVKDWLNQDTWKIRLK